MAKASDGKRGVATEEGGDEEGLIERVDSFVKARMKKGRVPGLVLVMVIDGLATFCRGYGMANIEEEIPITPATAVAIGPAAKGMTALAVMQLVEEGKVKLDVPVRHYVPYFRTADSRGEQITIRHLLSHCSGLPTETRYDGAQDDKALERYVRGLSSATLDRDPGSGFQYCNNGYVVLGALLQQVMGTPYEEYMEANLFGPMEMRRATFDQSQARRWGLARSYIRQGEEIIPGTLPSGRAMNPAEMLIASGRDLCNYMCALLSGGRFDGRQVISTVSLREMWAPAATVSPELSYGFGGYIAELGGFTVIHYPGEILTGGSSLILVPKRKLGVAVLSNLATDTKDQIARGVVSMVLGEELGA